MEPKISSVSSNATDTGSVPGTGKIVDLGRKSGKRRAEIIEQADRLFVAKGFHNVSFDDIAAEIGIKREALYYYFKNPSDILYEIVKPEMEQLIERLELITGSELRPVSKLFLAIESHIKVFHRTTLDAINLCNSAIYDDKFGHLHVAFRPFYKRYEDLWIEILASEEGKDLFNEPGNPKIVVFAILGMCNWMVRWFDDDGELDLEEVARIFFSMTGFGLLGRIEGKKPTFEAILGSGIEEIEAFKLVHGTR